MTRSGAEPRPLVVGEPLHGAYSHRDCQLDPPLQRSLAHGFTHIEVDVYCLAGRILVAHDLVELRPWRTLRRLYLEPLAELATADAGRIFRDGTPLTLFVDLKTSARGGYEALLSLLDDFPGLVASGDDDGPLRVILSGNRPDPAVVAKRSRRNVLLDGRSEDLGVFTDASIMPVVSDDWRRHFAWRGEGIFPSAEWGRLAWMVAQAHDHGQLLRLWGTPDAAGPAREAVWTMLLNTGVDLINTDDVAGLEAFLRSRRQSARADEPMTAA